MGLCKPVEYFQSHCKKNDIYGVLPFVAPEVLRGNPYTLASDIYSYSMIMWEFTSGIPPFNDRAHDFPLALSICKGERPKIIETIPQCYINLMKKCWDENPLKRPNASEVKNIIKNWLDIIRNSVKNDNIAIEFWKSEEKQTDVFKDINDKLIIKSHLQAYHTSHLLDFSIKLNEILEKENSECLDCLIND